MNNTINDVRREIETIEERRQVLKSEIHQLENEKQDLELDINLKEQREKERILPEIDRMNSLIGEISQEISVGDSKIQKEEKMNQEMEEKLAVMEKDKDEKKDRIE